MKTVSIAAIMENNNGGFILVGSIWDSVNSGATSNLSVCSINKDGSLLWTKAFDHSFINDAGNCIASTNDNGFVVAGTTQERSFADLSGGNKWLWIVKFNASGDTLWSKTIKIGPSDAINEIKQTNNDDYVILGTAKLGLLESQALLIKTDAYGNITSMCRKNPFLNKNQLNRSSQIILLKERCAKEKSFQEKAPIYNLNGKRVQELFPSSSGFYIRHIEK